MSLISLGRTIPIAYLASLFSLAACGGGSGSDSGATTPAPVPASGGVAPAPSPAPAPVAWWKPSLSDTWTVQLTGTVSTDSAIKVYDVDLFDTPASAIGALKSQGGRVICYFSAGSSEDWRSDFAKFLPADMGAGLVGWPGERWLDTASANVRSMMTARMDLAKTRGCDGIDPDNVDGYMNPTGLPLTAATQLDYNLWLAAQAHARGLAVSLKNDVSQLSQLADSHDFAVNEQCHEYAECAGYSAFIVFGKPVFNIEYASIYANNTAGARTAMCAQSAAMGMSTEVLAVALDGSIRIPCQ